MDSIIFDQKNYPTRDIFIPTYGIVTISTEELNDSLMNEDGSYSSREALYVDERIFFFVKKEDIVLNDNVLSEKVAFSL